MFISIKPLHVSVFFHDHLRGSSAVLCAVTILLADLRSLSLCCYTVCGRMCMSSVRVWCSCPLVIYLWGGGEISLSVCSIQFFTFFTAIEELWKQNCYGVKTMISKGCYINCLVTTGETMWSKHIYITLCFSSHHWWKQWVGQDNHIRPQSDAETESINFPTQKHTLTNKEI
jgi:hypothetical protein